MSAVKCLVIFSIFLFTACDQGFCTSDRCGVPEEVRILDAGVDTLYLDVSSEIEVIEKRFCDPTETDPGFVHLDIRWKGDEIVERDFFTDEVLSVREFEFSPYIVPQTYVIGVWCINWVRVGGQDFWTDYREIPFLGQEFATFSVDIPKEMVKTYDYCYAFVNVFCSSRGGNACWHSIEMVSGNENYPIVSVKGNIEYCIDGKEIISANIDDGYFYRQDREAYASGFYLNRI